MKLKEMMECVLKGLVKEPSEVKVSCFESEKSVVVEFKVADSDVGRVIGHKGETIKFLPKIFIAYLRGSGQNTKYYKFDFIHPEKKPEAEKTEESPAEKPPKKAQNSRR